MLYIMRDEYQYDTKLDLLQTYNLNFNKKNRDHQRR